jgi:hypothetical protein
VTTGRGGVRAWDEAASEAEAEAEAEAEGVGGGGVGAEVEAVGGVDAADGAAAASSAATSARAVPSRGLVEVGRFPGRFIHPPELAGVGGAAVRGADR